MRHFSVLLLLLSLGACSSAPAGSGGSKADSAVPLHNQHLQLTEVAFAALPGWTADDHAAALESFKRGCSALLKNEPEQRTKGRIPGMERTAQWQPVCREAQRINNTDARAFFEQQFVPYRVASNTGDAGGKFTGYYQISLNASRSKTARFKYPIYARPRDLTERRRGAVTEWGRTVAGKWQPYPTRAVIEKDGLGAQAKVLFWGEDPVDVFLLHIQGSGQVVLPDGTRHGIGFAARNGQPYGSIGTELIKRGALKPAETNIATIRAWLERNPAQRQDILNTNASYIFFKENNHLDPIGAMGVPLSPLRSLAVDPQFIPYGAPLWLDIPGNERLPGGLQKLVIAQDTGAAIIGAVRGDVFWGHDSLAEQRAGTMNNPGRYFILLPKQLLLADAS